MAALSFSTSDPVSSSSSPTGRLGELNDIQDSFVSQMDHHFVVNVIKEVESNLWSVVFLPLATDNPAAVSTVPTVMLTKLVSMLIDACLVPSDLPSEFCDSLKVSLSSRMRAGIAPWNKIMLDFESFVHTLAFFKFYFSSATTVPLQSSDKSKDKKFGDGLRNFMQSIIEHSSKISVASTPKSKASLSLYKTPVSQFQSPRAHDNLQLACTARSERWYTPHERVLPRVLDLEVTPVSSLSGTLSSIDPNTLPRGSQTPSSSVFDTPAQNLDLRSFERCIKTPLPARLSTGSRTSSGTEAETLNSSTEVSPSNGSLKSPRNSAGRYGMSSGPLQSNSSLVGTSEQNLSTLKSPSSNMLASLVEECPRNSLESLSSFQNQPLETRNKPSGFKDELNVRLGFCEDPALKQITYEFEKNEKRDFQGAFDQADHSETTNVCQEVVDHDGSSGADFHSTNQSTSAQQISSLLSREMVEPSQLVGPGEHSYSNEVMSLARGNGNVSDIGPDHDFAISNGQSCSAKSELAPVHDSSFKRFDEQTKTNLSNDHQEEFDSKLSLIDKKDCLTSTSPKSRETGVFEESFSSLIANQQSCDHRTTIHSSKSVDKDSRKRLIEEQTTCFRTASMSKVTEGPSHLHPPSDLNLQSVSPLLVSKSEPRASAVIRTVSNNKISGDILSKLPSHPKDLLDSQKGALIPTEVVDISAENIQENRHKRTVCERDSFTEPFCSGVEMPREVTDDLSNTESKNISDKDNYPKDSNDLHVIGSPTEQPNLGAMRLSQGTDDLTDRDINHGASLVTPKKDISPIPKFVDYKYKSDQANSTQILNNVKASILNSPQRECAPTGSGCGITTELCFAHQNPTSPQDFLSPELSDGKLERCISNLKGEQRVLKFGSKGEISEKESSDCSSTYSHSEVISATKLYEQSLKDLGEEVDDSALSEDERANQQLLNVDAGDADKADKTYDTSFFDNSEEILAHTLWEEENNTQEVSCPVRRPGHIGVVHDEFTSVIPPTPLTPYETFQSFTTNPTDMSKSAKILYSDPLIDEYDSVSEDRCVIVSDMVSKTEPLFGYEKGSYMNDNDTIKSTNSVKRMVDIARGTCSEEKLTVTDHRGSANAASTTENFEDDTLTLDGLDDMTEDVEMIGEQSVSSSDLTPAGLAMMRREAWQAVAARQDGSEAPKKSNVKDHPWNDRNSLVQTTNYNKAKGINITASSSAQREAGNPLHLENGEMVELMKSMSDMVRQNLLVCQQVKDEMLHHRRKTSKRASLLRDVTCILVSLLLLAGFVILLIVLSAELFFTKTRFPKVYV